MRSPGVSPQDARAFAGLGPSAYAALTWPLWLHAVSLLMAPFWFTPEVGIQ